MIAVLCQICYHSASGVDMYAVLRAKYNSDNLNSSQPYEVLLSLRLF